MKILLDAVGSSTIGDEILEILEKGRCQLAWYNPVRLYSIGRFNHRTHRKSLIIDGRVAFTGGAGIADHWMGHAQDDEHWRDIQIRMEGPAVMPLQTGFAQNWLQATGELITGFEFYPAFDEPAGTACRADDPELAGNRRLDRADVLLPVDRGGAANDRHREPVFHSRPGRHRSARGGEARGVDVRVMVAGIHNDNWMARQNSVRLYGPLLKAGIRSTNTTTRCCIRRRWWSTASGRPSARRTSTADRLRTTRRTTCASAIAQLAKELEEIFVADIKGCDGHHARRNGSKRPCWTRSVQAVVSLLQEQV